MSQYIDGTVTVTSGSAAVVGSGTLFSSHVTAGDIFTIVGSSVPYVVGSVTDDTHLTLTANYAGTTASGASYAITTSFTPTLGLPYPEQQDLDTATIIKRAMLLIESLLAAVKVTTPGDIVYATAANVLARLGLLADKKLFGNAAGTAPEWATGMKIITGSRNLATASGSVAYTGVGFKPSAVVVIGLVNGSTAAAWGLDDGTTPWCFYRDSSLGNFYSYPGDSFAAYVGAGPDGQHGHVASFDADGFTLAWTKQNSPTGTYAFAVLCLR